MFLMLLSAGYSFSFMMMLFVLSSLLNETQPLHCKFLHLEEHCYLTNDLYATKLHKVLKLKKGPEKKQTSGL